MCGPQRPNFWATLGLKMSKKSGLWSLSKKFPTGFASFFVYKSIRATFRGVLHIGPGGPQIDHNSSHNLSHFLKHFPLVSHYSCCTCLLGVLLCLFQLCAPKALFLGLELRLQRSLLGHHASGIGRVIDYIITSSNENVICVTVSVWEESTRHRWIPFTKGR